MSRAFWLLGVASIVAAAALTATPAVSEPGEDGPSRRFQDLIRVGDWVSLHPIEDKERLHFRVFTQEQKDHIEQTVADWKGGLASLEEEYREVQRQESRWTGVLTELRQQASRAQQTEADALRRKIEEMEVTLRETTDRRREVEAKRQPPSFVGERWTYALFYEVVETGEDFVGLGRDDYIVYYRLSDVAVVKRQVGEK